MGGTQMQGVSGLLGVKNHLRPWCSQGSDATTPLQSAPPEVFGLPFLLSKSLPDLLIASNWVVLSVQLKWNPSCNSVFLYQWLLALRLVELVTNASKGLWNKVKSAKNSQEKVSSFVKKQRLIACMVLAAGETVTEWPVVDLSSAAPPEYPKQRQM